MKAIILSSMMLFALLLGSCSEEGCVDVSKGTGMTHPSVAMTPYAATSVNCDGIADEYDGRYGEFSYSEILADINSRLRIKLIHDGNEPSWAPETITIGQLIGCEYTTRPAPDTECAQGSPFLYCAAMETDNIDHIKVYVHLYLDAYADYITNFSAYLKDGNEMAVTLDTPETGKHQAAYLKDPNKDELNYFYYENQ